MNQSFNEIMNKFLREDREEEEKLEELEQEQEQEQEEFDKLVERFYVKSKKPILVNGEHNTTEGFVECRIYRNGRYGQFLRGCCGRTIIIILDNGRIIKTNDLWYISESWTDTICGSDMTGKIIDDYREVPKYKDEDIHGIYMFV